MSHRVSVSKDYLTFSAAHFLTIPEHKCERLHGHNYVVTATVEGAVDVETGFLIDFAVLKRVLRPAIDALDHRVIVPGRNPRVRIRSEGDRTVVEYGGGPRFMFPSRDVAVVPVTDSTAELLAEYLARELERGLEREGAAGGVRRIVVEVEESPGQSGTFSMEVGNR